MNGFDHERLRLAVIEKRTTKGMNQYDVALESGVSKSTVSRIEAGERKFTLEVALKLARWVGLSARELSGQGAPVESKGGTLKAIREVLAHDEKLSASDADNLMIILRLGYEKVSGR